MSRRYLVPNHRYHVRRVDGSEIIAYWDEDAVVFRTGRGAERRVLDMSRIAAVAPVPKDEPRRTIQWTPWDECYRAKHRPRPTEARVSWVHPYRRIAA